MTPVLTEIVDTPVSALSGLRPRDPSPQELGRRIKMLRVSSGLTLKDLEERGGISATHVSEIERGKASPTVGALGRIARALGMRPAALVEPRAPLEVTVVRAAKRQGRRLKWGEAIIESLTEPLHCAGLGALLVRLPIGREPALTHEHEGEQWVLVMSGVAEIRVDQERFVLREGDTLHFRAHRTHSYCNLSSTETVLLTACRPRLSL
ncbi:MAG TPA: XRE family transcriptional regulator [Candidatus Limnocylindria bacterium]|nr:XRE family transcriptional regulator [Candidatus Limnocylindria bacterium]